MRFWIHVTDEEQAELLAGRVPATIKQSVEDEQKNNGIREALIERARGEHATDEVEVDDSASLSVADDGTWVMGWLWVYREDFDS